MSAQPKMFQCVMCKATREGSGRFPLCECGNYMHRIPGPTTFENIPEEDLGPKPNKEQE